MHDGDSNPRPLGHVSSTLTTRPRLLALDYNVCLNIWWGENPIPSKMTKYCLTNCYGKIMFKISIKTVNHQSSRLNEGRFLRISFHFEFFQCPAVLIGPQPTAINVLRKQLSNIFINISFVNSFSLLSDFAFCLRFLLTTMSE